jgi:hypothetical protein
MTNNEKWDSTLQNWSVYQKAEKFDYDFTPKIVEDIPYALKRRRAKFWTYEALNLAQANPMKWIITFEELVDDPKVRAKVAASARSSMNHLKYKGLPIEIRSITNDGRVQCYIRWMNDSE